LEGSKDLKRNIRTLITGYPAEKFYTDQTLGGYFLYKTGPTVTPYSSYEGKALTTTLVSTGPGNSGGPVWTKNAKGKWIASGVLVGGLPSESVVYTFSKDINDLFKAVTPVIRPEIQSPEKMTSVSATSIFFPYNRVEKIPDGEHKWTTFKMKVSHFGETALVKSVRLSLDIRTKHVGDLQVILAGPGGYQTVVHNEEGAGGDNLNLTDADFSSGFTGIVANGEWQLRVQDRLRGDVATFKSFVLEISAEGTASTTP
jgi:subtilisin-like proprotein convertase family protein